MTVCAHRYLDLAWRTSLRAAPSALILRMVSKKECLNFLRHAGYEPESALIARPRVSNPAEHRLTAPLPSPLTRTITTGVREHESAPCLRISGCG